MAENGPAGGLDALAASRSRATEVAERFTSSLTRPTGEPAAVAPPPEIVPAPPLFDAAPPPPAAPPPVDDSVGAKHMDDGAVAVEIVQPFGGAQTFAEYEQWSEAEDTDWAVKRTANVFGMLVDNIMNDGGLAIGMKLTKVGSLASEISAEVERESGKAIEDPEGTEIDFGFNGGFTAFKDQGGRWRWITVHSNKFEDREGETFAESAHKEYEAWVDQTGAFPALRFWHIPVDLGMADGIAYTDDGFLVGTGTFYKEYEVLAENMAARDDLGCSHGYAWRHKDRRDGVYYAYRDFEISVLPMDKVANRLTATTVTATEEMMSPLTGEKRVHFLELLGSKENPEAAELQVKVIDANLDKLAASAKAQGIAFKDLGSFGEALFGMKADVAPTAEPPAAVSASAEPPAETGTPETPPETDTSKTDTPETPAEEADPGTGAIADPPAETPTAADASAAEKAMNSPEAVLGDLLAEAVRIGTAGIDGRMNGLEQGMKAIAEKVGMDVDAEVARRIKPRVGPIGGEPASTSTKNIVDAQEADALAAVVATTDGGTHQPKGAHEVARQFLGDALGRVGAVKVGDQTVEEMRNGSS